jgi:putative ABC transport system substrate-binding protein
MTPGVLHAKERAKNISINQFIRHPALDAVQRGFMEYFKDTGFPVKFRVHIANGDIKKSEDIAMEIANEDPDLVLAIATPSSQACTKYIQNKTIIFSAVTDPVGAGLVKSLKKPGVKVTGMTDMSPVDRHMSLIMELQPNLKKLGVIFNPNESNSVSIIRLVEEECARYKIKVVKETAGDKKKVIPGAEKLVGRCDAVYVPTDNTVVAHIESVVRLFVKKRIPLYAADIDSVPRGAILALAINYYKMGRQTARMAARIFNGEDPSKMPVETLEALSIHLNTKAAEVMGINLPVDLLNAADVLYDSLPE